jgi:hypothetical protein
MELQQHHQVVAAAACAAAGQLEEPNPESVNNLILLCIDEPVGSV